MNVARHQERQIVNDVLNSSLYEYHLSFPDNVTFFFDSKRTMLHLIDIPVFIFMLNTI